MCHLICLLRLEVGIMLTLYMKNENVKTTLHEGDFFLVIWTEPEPAAFNHITNTKQLRYFPELLC